MNLQTLACTVLCAAILSGCQKAVEEPISNAVEVKLTLVPSPPVVGNAEVTLTLSNNNGESIKGAKVRLEGNMNHAGMKPSFADLIEQESGKYTGTLKFTMGGDWFIIVTATTEDGQRVERKIDVTGVQQP